MLKKGQGSTQGNSSRLDTTIGKSNTQEQEQEDERNDKKNSENLRTEETDENAKDLEIEIENSNPKLNNIKEEDNEHDSISKHSKSKMASQKKLEEKNSKQSL